MSRRVRKGSGGRAISGRTAIQMAAAAAAMVAAGQSAMAALTHRYTFNNGNANDSAPGGTAHGTAVSRATYPDGSANPGITFTNGQVNFNNPGNSAAIANGNYVDLPNNIARTSALTIEGWATWNGGNAWQRFFDFGETTVAPAERPPDNLGGGYNGNESIYITPMAGGDAGNGRQNNLGSEIRDGGTSQFSNAPFNQAFPTGGEHHFALVKSGNTLSLFMDGELVGQNANATVNTANINQLNVWLGRSNWAADPFFNGSMNEFRIYDHALNEAGIAQSFAAGPNAVAADVNWVAATGNWTVGTNWSNGTGPGPADTAVVGNAGTADITTPVTQTVTRLSNGTINISNTGSLSTFLEVAAGSNAATLNLNGGTLTLRTYVADSGNGAKAINLNGGTVVIPANITVSGTNLTTTVGASGITFDLPNTATGTKTANWNPPLVSTGGSLNKIGPGRLNLNGGGFNGPINVRAGRLDAAGSVGSDTARIRLGDTSVDGGSEALLFLTGSGTIRGGIDVGTPGSFGFYTLGASNNASVSVPGSVVLNSPLTIVTGAGTNALTLGGGIRTDMASNTLTFDNIAPVVIQNVGITEGAGGIGLTVSKTNTGVVQFLAPNSYTGPTQINSGTIWFNAPNTVGGTGPTVSIGPAGVAVAGPGFDHTNITGQLLSRIDPLSSGSMALTQNSSENFDFATPGYNSLFLGAASNVTYTGTITPAAFMYRLGGGGGAMVLPNTNQLTGDNGLVITGAGGGGTVELTALNNYTGGTLIQQGGTLVTSNENQLGTGSVGINFGSIQFNGTAPMTFSKLIGIDAGGGGFIVNPPSVTLTGGMLSQGINATGFNKTGPGELILGGGQNYDLGAKPFLVRSGTLRVQNNSTLSNVAADGAFLSIGVAGTERATLVIGDTSSINVGEGLNLGDTQSAQGTLLVRDNATINTRGLFVGKNANTQGVVLQTGGTVTSRAGITAGVQDWRIAGNNNAASTNTAGSYTLTGGRVGTAGNFQIGANGKGVMTITGGTASAGNFTSVGRFANSYGVLTVEGTGVWEHTNPFSFMIVGENGTGFLNVENGGTVSAGGGGLRVALAANGRGAVNLRPGGTITATHISGVPGVASALGQFNFHGGTLKPMASTTGFMDNVSQALVWQGGANIDTDGKDITIRQNFSAPTGSGVTNIPLTAGGSGYIAHPVVALTGGGGTGAAAVAIMDASGTITGIRITNPGVGYTSAPAVTFHGGGATTPATAGAAALGANVGGGLTKTGAGTLTLAGTSTLTGPTTINQGTLRLGAPPAAGLTHRYNFNTEGAATAEDTAGDADGLLVGGATVTGGRLVLANSGTTSQQNTPGSGQYVDLPNNVARTSSLTIEGWATLNTTNAWQRFFDFGYTSGAGEHQPGSTAVGYTGQSALYITPRSGGQDMQAEHRVNPTSRFANADLPPGTNLGFPADGTEHQFALTKDAATDTLSLYYDGQLVARNTNAPEDAALIEMVNSWIGRSNWSGDPHLAGTINEFRIYDRAVTDAGILANFQAGPDGAISTDFTRAPQRVTLTTSGLNLGAAGTLDVTDSAMVVNHNGADSPQTAVRAALASGKIITSNSQTDPRVAVGYAESASLLGPTGGTFMGQAVDGTSLLVRYTLSGDTDLNQVVNFDDLARLAQNYNNLDGNRVWLEGDFTYDGNVNFDDLAKLAQNYNTGLPAAAELVALGGAGFAEDVARAFAQVPEPGAITLLGLAAGALGMRRRRTRG